MESMPLIDLHVHSNCSDGKKSVEEILMMCLKNNVGVISFAEHYNMGSYKKARRLGEEFEIEVIPSIEIGTSMSNFGLSNNHICHIVAYYSSYSICRILDNYELSKDKCVKRTLEKLPKSIPLSYTQVKKYARDKGSIGRFDVAIALAKLGYCEDPILAYGEFLDAGKTAYVNREKEDPVDLIKKITELGGIPTIVHPKSIHLSYDNELKFYTILKDAGLCGIEAYNPHHTEDQTEHFLDIANYFDLIPTVGSDYHGNPDSDIEIGTGIDNNLEICDYSMIFALKFRKKLLDSSVLKKA
jgi:predicted metal-dependent phosphoesterase TrpH